MPNLWITIDGKPQQQGSKTAFVIKGRAVLTEANKNLMPWRKQATATMVKQALTQGWEAPTTEAVKLTVLFIFERPKTVKRKAMTVKPDIDHLIRSIGDAGTQANLYPDDSQITQIIARKKYGNHPKTVVVLTYERTPLPNIS